MAPRARTTPRPGDGTLYTDILDQIDLKFSYAFDCYPELTNTTVSQEFSIELESPEKWTRELSPEEVQEVLRLDWNNNFTLIVYSTRIQSIVEDIEECWIGGTIGHICPSPINRIARSEGDAHGRPNV